MPSMCLAIMDRWKSPVASVLSVSVCAAESDKQITNATVKRKCGPSKHLRNGHRGHEAPDLPIAQINTRHWHSSGCVESRKDPPHNVQRLGKQSTSVTLQELFSVEMPTQEPTKHTNVDLESAHLGTFGAQTSIKFNSNRVKATEVQGRTELRMPFAHAIEHNDVLCHVAWCALWVSVFVSASVCLFLCMGQYVCVECTSSLTGTLRI